MGAPVRHDGSAKSFDSALLENWRSEGRLELFCPELAGGFPIPRAPAEIAPDTGYAELQTGSGRVIDIHGADVTTGFRKGAELALAQARATGCAYALLTDGSPSCGSSYIYDGTHSGQRRAGMGLLCAMLRGAGIAVFAPSQIAELAERVHEDHEA